jgi:hypothetical protein
MHRAWGIIDPTLTMHVVSIENLDLLRKLNITQVVMSPVPGSLEK